MFLEIVLIVALLAAAVFGIGGGFYRHHKRLAQIEAKEAAHKSLLARMKETVKFPDLSRPAKAPRFVSRSYTREDRMAMVHRPGISFRMRRNGIQVIDKRSNRGKPEYRLVPA